MAQPSPRHSEDGSQGLSKSTAPIKSTTAAGTQAITPGTQTPCPAKRPRTDHEDELSDDDKTTCYSVDDAIEVDEDKTPFTLVSYKKDRPAGIPVVFKPITSEQSFWRVNPNTIANEILNITKEKLLSHRINKDGSMTVSVASLQSANRLLAVTSLSAIEVTTSVPNSYSRNLGKIKGVPLEYSDDELLEYLKDFGVISVQRQVSYRRQDDGNTVSRKTESVLLHFRPDRAMPQRILLGFTSHPVDEYFGPPVQCFKCQRYGHIANFCRGPTRCKVCAGAHNHKECTSKQEPKCANCGGGHSAAFAGCPIKKAASTTRKRELLNGREVRTKAPILNPEVVRPPPCLKSLNDTAAKKVTYRDAVKDTSKTNKEKISDGKSQLHGSCSCAHRTALSSTAEMPTKENVPGTSITRTNCSQPVSASSAPRRNRQEQRVDIGQLVLPMLFAALKAIINALPNANDLPEVRALLTMEPLIKSTCLTVSGHFDD